MISFIVFFLFGGKWIWFKKLDYCGVVEVNFVLSLVVIGGVVNFEMLLFSWVIFFISWDVIDWCFVLVIKNIILILGFKWWFMFIIWNLYLKLDIVCNFWIIMFVLIFLVKFISRFLNGWIVMVVLFFFVKVVVFCLIIFICLFKLKRGFLFWLIVILIIRWFINLIVCFIIFRCFKVIGLKVFGYIFICFMVLVFFFKLLYWVRF